MIKQEDGKNVKTKIKMKKAVNHAKAAIFRAKKMVKLATNHKISHKDAHIAISKARKAIKNANDAT